MNDPLSELLRVAGVRGSLISRMRMGLPYGVSTRGMDRAIFHTPLRGYGWCQCGDLRIRLDVGDVLVLPRGDPHAITSEPEGESRNINSFTFDHESGRLPTVVDEARGDTLDLLCGSFTFGDPARAWLLDPLPDAFVVRGVDAATTYIEATLGLLEAELAGRGLGSTLVSDRLVEVLVVHLLRTWSASKPSTGQGWLSGMADPQLGRVMSAVQAEPTGDWSLEKMARHAGLSRTRFVARFREQVGISPGNWMTDWRIAVARRALRDGAGVAAAATAAGYASEASFSRAFKRIVGRSPGAWRSEVVSPA